MRNRVIHDYGHVEFDIVWDTVERQLPPLLAQLKLFFDESGEGS